MSTYHLFQQAQDVTSASVQLPGVSPSGPENANHKPTQQTFQLIVTGVNAVTATAQAYGSNDGSTWTAIGDPISVSGTAPQAASFTTTTSFRRYAGALTALTGTAAMADLTMSV